MRALNIVAVWLGLWGANFTGALIESGLQNTRRIGTSVRASVWTDHSPAGSVNWMREDGWFCSTFGTLLGGQSDPSIPVAGAPAWLQIQGPGHAVRALAFGWPARAFASRAVFLWSSQPDASGVRQLEVHWLLRVWPPSWHHLRFIGPILPNRIIWSGVMVDGVTCAAMIALVVFTHRRLRLAMFRRRAKTPCLRCGYERLGLGPQAPCPECGAPAPIARGADASSG